MKYIIASGFVREKNVIVLVPNNWDDYSYKTTFEAKYTDKEGTEFDLGTIKIGKDGLDSGWVEEYLGQENLRSMLLKHKVALQPNKHVEIWFRLCYTFADKFQGDVRNLFLNNDNSVKKVKEYILANKKSFPYLSGTKILNYWLYVMTQYTDASMEDRQYITVAPDTHVIQASERLGLISHDELEKPTIREKVSLLWEEVFKETERCSIDEYVRQLKNAGISFNYTLNTSIMFDK